MFPDVCRDPGAFSHPLPGNRGPAVGYLVGRQLSIHKVCHEIVLVPAVDPPLLRSICRTLDFLTLTLGWRQL